MCSRSSFVLFIIALLSIGFLVSWFPALAAAQDFSNMFGSSEAASAFRSPFDQSSSAEDQPQTRIVVRPSIGGSIGLGTRVFCVRTCDGRYFPIASGTDASRKEFCKSACPAAETKVYSGSSIETATADGKPYSKFANAFRYRNEFVPGCSCQGEGKFGLAHIRVEDDKTIRVGDIVANANGLMVASRAGRKGIIFARIHAARLKAERLPAVASH